MDDHDLDCPCEDCEALRRKLLALFAIGLMISERLVHA